MEKFLWLMALLGNVVFILLAAVFTFSSRSFGDREFLFIILLMLVPVLNLTVLRRQPDLETRQLRREVEKARLRRELQQLTDAAAPVSPVSTPLEKGGCCPH